MKKSLVYAHSPAAIADAGLREQLRNSVIQCFEFTHELSWKILKRYLEETEASSGDMDSSTFQNLIRLASERGLLHLTGTYGKPTAKRAPTARTLTMRPKPKPCLP